MKRVGTLLVCAALILSGCAPRAPLSSSSEIATRQANAWLPKGTPQERATRILRQKGFQLSRLNTTPSAGHLLVGTYTERKHTWLVGVVILDGKVVACSVTVSEAS